MQGKLFCLFAWNFVILFLITTGLAKETPTISSNALSVLICYPGGSPMGGEVQSGVDSLIRILEDTGSWHRGTIKSFFTSEEGECRAYLDKQGPQFVIADLELFLRYREKLDFIPLVQPLIHGSSSERYRIVVKKGTYSSLESLKGKTLGGSLLGESSFLKRIIFEGKIDPTSFFVLRPSRRVLRSLRNLVKGELDAVMLNSQQYRALGALPFAAELRVVFTSAEFPLVGVVANGKKTTAEQRKRFANALTGLCEHQEGRQLCELFGVEDFVPVGMDAFKKVIYLWDAGM